MKVTNIDDNSRKLNKDYLQKVSSEKKEYVEVLSQCKITENNTTITEFQTDKLLEKILHRDSVKNTKDCEK
jgi:RNA-directed DNA polymerase